MNNGVVVERYVVPKVDDATAIEWYDLRDTFLGINFHGQDIPKALAGMRTCKHPDAQWLYVLLKRFHGRRNICHLCVRDFLERQAFRVGPDARIFYFMAMLSYNDESTCVYNCSVDHVTWNVGVKRDSIFNSASSGYPAAASEMYENYLQDILQRLRWFRIIVDTEDPRGLGYMAGHKQTDDKDRYVMYERAAFLGNVHAKIAIAESTLHYDDPEYYRVLWRIYQKYAKSNAICQSYFTEGLKKAGCVTIDGVFHNLNIPAMYVIGELLDNYDETGLSLAARKVTTPETFFGTRTFSLPAVDVRYHYRQWRRQVQQCIQEWLLISRRFGVVKDIRLVISRQLWGYRAQWRESAPSQHEEDNNLNTVTCFQCKKPKKIKI
jgi:hypothetical protein